MKKLALLSLLGLIAVAAVLSSCGSNQIQALPTSNVNGNWQAELTGGTGPAAQLNFLANFNLFVTNGSGNQGLNINDIAFLNVNSCFPNGAGGKGYINLTNNLNNGKITGAIGLTLTSSTGNILTLSADPNLTPPTGQLIATSSGSNGTLTNGGVNGGWWLTAGSGSSDSACTAGSQTNPLPFIMCQNAATCTTALGPSISPHF